MGEAALTTGLGGATEDGSVETPAARATRRLLRRKGAAFGLFVIALLVALAVFAPLISPYDPNLQTWTAVRKAPSALHWFGTDDLGRDVLTGIIGAFLSKGMEGQLATATAARVHADAALAAPQARGLIASDVIAALPMVLERA
jgi:peptide/nickel transport system permease protein